VNHYSFIGTLRPITNNFLVSKMLLDTKNGLIKTTQTLFKTIIYIFWCNLATFHLKWLKSSIVLSTQCHDPYHKIRHVFIPKIYHPIISFDIQDENLKHDEMSAMRHAIVGIQNKGCIGYCLVSFISNHLIHNALFL